MVGSAMTACAAVVAVGTAVRVDVTAGVEWDVVGTSVGVLDRTGVAVSVGVAGAVVGVLVGGIGVLVTVRSTAVVLGVLVGVSGPALVVYLWAWDGPAWLPHTRLVRIVGTLLGLAIATAGYTFPVLRYFQRQAAAGGSGRWAQTDCCSPLAAHEIPHNFRR